jgi:hypothetical protein
MRRNRIRKRELTQRRWFTNLARPMLLAQPGAYRLRPEVLSEIVEGIIIGCVKTIKHIGFDALGDPQRLYHCANVLHFPLKAKLLATVRAIVDLPVPASPLSLKTHRSS